MKSKVIISLFETDYQFRFHRENSISFKSIKEHVFLDDVWGKDRIWIVLSEKLGQVSLKSSALSSTSNIIRMVLNPVWFKN